MGLAFVFTSITSHLIPGIRCCDNETHKNASWMFYASACCSCAHSRIYQRMDDLYAINLAKTTFREAYNSGDPEPIVALLDLDAIYFADSRQMAIGSGVADAIRRYMAELWAECEVTLVPIIIEIRIQGDVACEYGWHEWQFARKDGSPPVTRKDRYVDFWRKNASGEWRLWTYIDNVDVPMHMPALVR